MRAGRLILVVATLVTILVFPVLVHDALNAFKSPNAYAAPGVVDAGGRLYQNGNNNNNNNGNRNGNNNNNNNNNNNDEDDNNNNNGNRNGNGNNNNKDGNDNIECFNNLNENEAVPCDFNTNGNDNRRGPAAPAESVNRPTKCFDTREVGVIQLGTGSYDVTIQVMPHSSFGQTTRLTLRPLDPATQPAVSGGTLLDTVVFQLDAQSDCAGASIGTLPNAVNLGITYNVANTVDKSRLQIVRWNGSSWTNVTTVPDPNPGNPYISATITESGTYAVIQRP